VPTRNNATAQRRQPRWLSAFAVLLPLAVAAAVAVWAATTPVVVELTREPPPEWVSKPSESAVAIAERAGTDEPAATAAPIEIHIDAIGVTAPVIDLGLNADNTLEVPEDFDVTGWWAGGSKPTEPGPAVIVGHVDSYEGPAVFFDLDELEPGDEIAILGADGSTTWFAVQRGEWHPKDEFPSRDVYGDTEEPELRLVTCGGEFDRQARSYLSNYIVFATQIDAPDPKSAAAR
jgi:sortase (surface protein transpeptidase)